MVTHRFLCMLPLISSASLWVVPCSSWSSDLQTILFSPMLLSWISPSHLPSILFNPPWNVLLSKYTTCCHGSLGMHRVAEQLPALGLQGQLLPQAQKILPGFLVGCSQVHPLISPTNDRGDSYSFFLLCCFLKHPRADLWGGFPEHLRLGTNFSLSPSLKLSVRVKVTLCSARHHSCPAEPSCLSLKFPMIPLCSHISFIFLFFQDCCQLKIQPFDQAVQTVA